jgi:hypothetical protein
MLFDYMIKSTHYSEKLKINDSYLCYLILWVGGFYFSF